MVRGSVRVAAVILTTSIAFSGMTITADAASATSVLPSGGVDLTIAKGNTLENITTDVSGSALQIQSILEPAAVEAAVAQEEKAREEAQFRTLVIAQVNDYVNVRSIASEEGEIIGKLYDDSVGTFISEENGWYQISSGSVTGYVKAEYCVTGEAAIELARQVGTRIATVTTTTLKVRTEPSLDASVLGLVPIDDDLVVLEETEDWVKVDIEEGIGWVSTDYVSLHTEFVQAESKEEEERRLAKEAEERRKALEAASARVTQSQSSSGSGSSANYSVGSGSEMGVAVAEYALQFVGNPYVYGGTSLTEGADCSGFVMCVYANFCVRLPHSTSADRSQG